MSGGDVSAHQIGFGWKMVVQRHFRDTGTSDDAVDACAVDALVVKHAGGGIEDFVFGGTQFSSQIDRLVYP